jgi:hypothetical protein
MVLFVFRVLTSQSCSRRDEGEGKCRISERTQKPHEGIDAFEAEPAIA